MESSMTDLAFIQSLFETIKSRKDADPSTSYVASLFSKGTAKIAQKVGEEAVETAIEALQGDKEKLKQESADLLFHLMVLWADQGIEPHDVVAVLKAREGTSGVDEKASRSKD
jgi:phosphoribosyl-ATP pyrophosphohydrolase